MTIWLVTTRDLKLQEHERMVKKCSWGAMLDQYLSFEKNLAEKSILAWRTRFVKKLHLELEKFRFFLILKIVQNNGLKSSKNDGFLRFLRNPSQISIFSYFSHIGGTYTDFLWKFQRPNHFVWAAGVLWGGGSTPQKNIRLTGGG